MKNLVSVIITTYNSSATLKKLLESIKSQSYKKIEVIVVDNNSQDLTKEIARKFTKLVFQKGPERSAQRNFGAQQASGEYFLFLDSDMILTTDVIKECLVEVKNKKIGAVVIPEKSFGQGFWAKVKAFERDINQKESFFEAARFYPRKVYKQYRGYDESLTGPEDWDLPRRVEKKYQIGRSKALILHNEGRLSLKTLYKKKFYYGLSAHKFISKHNLSILSPTTVYFLRPAYYRNFSKLIAKPLLFGGLIIMLTVETIGGGLGYFLGRLKNE